MMELYDQFNNIHCTVRIISNFDRVHGARDIIIMQMIKN